MSRQYSKYPHQPTPELTEAVRRASMLLKAKHARKIWENAQVDYVEVWKDWKRQYDENCAQYELEQAELAKLRNKWWENEH